MLWRPAAIAAIGLPVLAFGFAASAGELGRKADTSACSLVTRALPPVGSKLATRPIADIIAARSPSVLRIDPVSAGGLSLESTYAGSLSCQRNTLYETTSAGRKKIVIPAYFGGGEGALCGADRVRLATVNGTPALLNEDSRDNGSDLSITQRISGTWTPICHMTIETAPYYDVLEQFCDGGECSALQRAATKIITNWRRDLFTEGAIAADKLPKQYAASWKQILRLAGGGQIESDPLPTLGTKPDNYRGQEPHYEHTYAESTFIPIVVNDQLLLGKVGPAGISVGREGSAYLFSAYRLAGNSLGPIAGFYLDITSKELRKVTIY